MSISRLGIFRAGPGEALGAVLTDGLFSCTANISNEIFSLSVPTYGYQFDDENAPTPELPRVSFPYGATHTDELQFLFTLASTPSALSSAETNLAGVMQNYWSSFARNGTPNSLQTPPWAPFSIAADNIQSLNTPRPGGGIRIRGAASLQLLDRRVGTNCSRQRGDRANVCRDSATAHGTSIASSNAL
jgi:hypothetical protein